MKKRMIPLLFVISCAGLAWLSGCGPTRLAGGTETQNPEIVACVKKMADAAFDAADAGSAWRPTNYLQDSAPGASLGKTAKRAAFSSSAFPVIVIASWSDTAIIGDSIEIIRDTALVTTKAIKLDTVLVDRKLFFTDTLADTVRSVLNDMSRVSIVVRLAADSIIVKDTVVMIDTVDLQYKRATVSVKRLSSEIAPTVIDTQQFRIDTLSSQKFIDEANPAGRSIAPSPSWKLDSIVYSSIDSPVVYRVVSPPTKDTALLSPSVNALSFIKNEQFLSSEIVSDGIRVETITFNSIDSLLSIGRFNPSPFDTVESLSTRYSIDIGADKYSGADDRLLGISRQYLYRLGSFHYLELTLSPDQANSPGNTKKIYNGMISMKIIFSSDKTGVFSGFVDSDLRLIGVYEIDGKKYQVTCDHAFTIHVVEMLN